HRARTGHHPQARAHDGRRRDSDERARQRFGIYGATARRHGSVIKPRAMSGSPRKRTSVRHSRWSQKCRFCCKSLFALAIKISFGCTGDFHVNIWGTSSSEEKLAGDPGNVIEATSIGGRRSDFLQQEKLAPGNFGLLQQYLPGADICLVVGTAT